MVPFWNLLVYSSLKTVSFLSRVLLAFASIIADFSFFRAVLFSTDMRKKRYWEGERGKMEERTKAADDYATTFSTNNLCKQLMYPQKKTRRCINWRNAKQSPLQRISSQSQGEHAEGGTFNDLHPAPLPAPSAQTHPARQLLEARPHMFRSSNR